MELSSLGLGTYLGPSTEAADAAYAEAARAFFAAGGNVFDTAANYRGGRSERALGVAFQGLPREGFFVSTKAGYVPMPEATDPDEGPRAWFHRVFEVPGILAPEDLVDGCHALTPRYLAHQLEVSRAALGLDTIDLFHLHNPEQQLAHLGPDGFYAMITRAFEACEGFVAAGKIRAYGVATWNGFRVPPGQDGHLSLARLLGAATSAGGGNHHFRWIQLPLNLAMPEAYLAPTPAHGWQRDDSPGRGAGRRAVRTDLRLHHAGADPPAAAGGLRRSPGPAHPCPGRPAVHPLLPRCHHGPLRHGPGLPCG
ncbi:MAG: aldo/keto reductase [Holophagaceae bacterium]|uniref:Aldo/keto reductase n=1 Tax=Candidatus Geothrix odensensis TaxID=2954440 RepID=A0A936K6K0_9BACT|nr:aldo/keto reductase [Candidatus Geothrix odensensis]